MMRPLRLVRAGGIARAKLADTSDYAVLSTIPGSLTTR